MKTYALQIVEDDSVFSDLLENHIQESYSNIKHIGTASTIEKSLLLFLKHKPDILLLDIQLGEQDSFAFLEKINIENTIIIFISSHANYAIDSIKFRPFGYLLKPLDKSKLDLLLHKAFLNVDITRDKQLMEGKLELVSKQTIEFIPFKDIQYIEADGAYTDVYHSNNQKSTVSYNLSVLEQKLPSTFFIRIHSKYIVNKLKVQSIQKTNGASLELFNGSVLPVSRRRMNDVLAQLR